MREYDTGATRDDKGDKLDYEGFLSPIVLKRFAEYMHVHRKQADNKLRAADNWQHGIPEADYMDSLWRHFMDVWLFRRGHEIPVEYEDALCAVLFNVQGLLHERLKKVDSGEVIPFSELKSVEAFTVRTSGSQEPDITGFHTHPEHTGWAIKNHTDEWKPEEHDMFRLHHHVGDPDGHEWNQKVVFWLSEGESPLKGHDAASYAERLGRDIGSVYGEGYYTNQ